MKGAGHGSILEEEHSGQGAEQAISAKALRQQQTWYVGRAAGRLVRL